MKKITWLIIILTLIIWLAIAHYWTGTSSINPRPTPASPTTIEVEVTPTPEVVSATPSAVPVLDPSATPSTDLKY